MSQNLGERIHSPLTLTLVGGKTKKSSQAHSFIIVGCMRKVWYKMHPTLILGLFSFLVTVNILSLMGFPCRKEHSNKHLHAIQLHNELPNLEGQEEIRLVMKAMNWLCMSFFISKNEEILSVLETLRLKQ